MTILLKESVNLENLHPNMDTLHEEEPMEMKDEYLLKKEHVTFAIVSLLQYSFFYPGAYSEKVQGIQEPFSGKFWPLSL